MGNWLGVSLILGLSLILVGCASLTCSEAERAVFAEFPQYGNTQAAPAWNADTGACAVYYEVSDPPEQVREYFIEQLDEHGWTVDPAPSSGTLVLAERAQLTYIVYYETPNSVTTPGVETVLAIHVEEHAE